MPECCEDYADHIFVFGSNEAGRHGKGAALHAVQCHGATYGIGRGPQWNWRDENPLDGKPRSYAIPTKDAKLRALPLDEIRREVDWFLRIARSLPERRYYVTRIGCGLAGYTEDEIAPMFANAPDNCVLPETW